MSAVFYRRIAPAEAPALFAIRTATHENRLTRAALTALGITETSVSARLAGGHPSWLGEVDGQVVGFAMGEPTSGELWVIAVLPEFIGRGIGGELLRRVEADLAAGGWARLWLTTDVDPTLKAYGFYRHHGWRDERIENGLRYMVKDVAAGGGGNANPPGTAGR